MEKAITYYPEHRITFEMANELGFELKEKRQYEEAHKYYIAAYEGRKKLFGEDDKSTLQVLRV